jgi:hypothetical protein
MAFQTITKLLTTRQMGKLLTSALIRYRDKLLTAPTDIPRDSPPFKAALFECHRMLAFRGVTFDGKVPCPACRGYGRGCSDCQGSGVTSP